MEKPLTVDQAAAILGYHPDHLRRLLRRGQVKGERFNRAWMIDLAEVQRVKDLQGKGGRLPRAPRQ